MKNFRKGSLLGMVSGVLALIGLYLNFIVLKGPNETLKFSLHDFLTWEGFQKEDKTGENVFTALVVFAVLTIAFALWSNKKNGIGVLTLISSGVIFSFAFLFNSVFNIIEHKTGYEFVSAGPGFYLLMAAGILGAVGAFLAILKK